MSDGNCDQNVRTSVLSPLIIVWKIFIITTTNALSIDFGHVGCLVTWINNRCIIHIVSATSESMELVGDCVLMYSILKLIKAYIFTSYLRL